MSCDHNCQRAACDCIHADNTHDGESTDADFTYPVGAGHMPVTGLAAQRPEPSRSVDGFNFSHSPFPADGSY